MPQLIAAIIVIYLLYLLVRYVVIPIVIAIVMFIVAVVTFSATVVSILAVILAIIGAGGGGVVSLYSFITAVRKNLRKRHLPAGHCSPTDKKYEEHSHEQYFYWNGDWHRNLKAIIRDTVKGNWDYVAKCWKWVAKGWWGWVAAKFCAGIPACIFIVAGAFVFLPIFFVPYVLVTVFMWLLVNVVSLEMHWLERIFLKIHGLSLTCPECSRKVDLPIYRCPSCKREQKRLLPTNRYGAIYRICACGEHLPTSRFFGRNQLPAYCNHEEERIESGTPILEKCREKWPKPLDRHAQNVKPATIMFLGGPRSGKTRLYHTILSMLLKGYRLENGDPQPPLYQSPTRKWERRLSAESLQKLDGPNGIHQAYRISHSETTQKDDDEMLKAFCVDLKRRRWKFFRRLHIYDVAGEYFDEMEELKKLKYYEHLRAAAVLVVDPFAIHDLRSEYEAAGGTLPEQASEMSPMEALNRWRNTMESHFPGIARQFCCAIVINKTDTPLFHEVTGLSAGATHKECIAFLGQRYGMGNLLQMVEDNFREHQCFAVSITPGQSDGQEPCPIGLENMIDWLLQKTVTQ